MRASQQYLLHCTYTCTTPCYMTIILKHVHTYTNALHTCTHASLTYMHHMHAPINKSHYIHTCTHTCIHASKHAHMHTKHKCMCGMHRCTHCMHTCMRQCMHEWIAQSIGTCKDVYAHARIYMHHTTPRTITPHMRTRMLTRA